MTLHVFNPEHDMALAANQSRFTPPHAGRQMRADLGFLPALWAQDGDMVLVDDVEAALEAVRHIRKYAHEVVFVSEGDLSGRHFEVPLGMVVQPWGWDLTLKGQLRRVNPSLASLAPSDVQLELCRTMSSRRFAAEHLLPCLHDAYDGAVGESVYCSSVDEALACMSRYGKSVAKSPWSSSGRGVRYILASAPDGHTIGWMRNIVRQQGGIMVEPYYAKVYDFAVEFCAHDDGNVGYCGLSLFDTRGGAYTGSICATEDDKRKILSRYVDMALLDDICQDIRHFMSDKLRGVYVGPFGVDMMVVAKGGDGFLLHPCVELNLRRTMGHVALALSPTPYEPQRLMSIYYADKYRIRVQTLTDNLLNTAVY